MEKIILKEKVYINKDKIITDDKISVIKQIIQNILSPLISTGNFKNIFIINNWIVEEIMHLKGITCITHME